MRAMCDELGFTIASDAADPRLYRVRRTLV
jgi:hypothetical protein